MIEFGLKHFKSLKDFKNDKIGANVKPTLIFNGFKWKVSEELRRIRSLLIDMFHVEDVSAFLFVQFLSIIPNFPDRKH